MGRHIPATPPYRHFPPQSSLYDPYGRRVVPEPLTPAASWQEGFWSRLLTRYLSMKALVEVCEIDVEAAALQEVERSASEASINLGMTDAQTRDFAKRVIVLTRVNEADYCSPDNQYRSDLMASFPRPPSVR
jgi:hypothetical protein